MFSILRLENYDQNRNKNQEAPCSLQRRELLPKARSQKQQWQAREGGLFGKQNSERLKNIFGAELFKKQN